ncbi:MAG: hypothetical protein LBK61_12510, partial [Spirochaetaceae bacterium]|nr:hypothetical protein [Spirochaetaceae bacterium]
MAKRTRLWLSAAVAVCAVWLGGCGAIMEFLGFVADNPEEIGAQKIYKVSVQTTGKGEIKVPTKVVAGSEVTVRAVPADETGQGGGPWNINTLSITSETGKEVEWGSTADNEWSFTMPKADVSVSAKFVQSGTPSNKLSQLSVSRGAFTEDFLSEKTSYQVDIPHISEESPTFTINAFPEYSSAVVTVTAQSNPQTTIPPAAIPLVEGTTTYAVTVTPPAATKLNPNTYTVSVDYAPDLTLGAVTVTPAETSISWTKTLDAAAFSEGQQPVVHSPWPIAKIAATAAAGTTVTISNIGGTGSLAGGAGTATHTFATPQSANGAYTVANPTGAATLGITVSKQAGGKKYSSEYTLTLDWDYWAASTKGTREFKQIDGNWYELHTFKVASATTSLNDTFTFKDGAPASPPVARVLVVGGGGGAGSGNNPTGGAGAGGMVEHDNFSMT